jgi:hypothetical protein
VTAWAFSLWGLLGLLAGVVPATPPTIRVLLVIDQPDDPFVERIRAELSGLGLAVLTLEPWRTGEAVSSLAAAAQSQQAEAAIRMIPTRKGVEVWLADQNLGRPLLRQLVVDESPEGPNQGLVALQTAELLRTSLLSGSSQPRVTPEGWSSGGATVVSPAVVDAAAEPEGKVGVEAAVGTFFSPGGTNTALQLWLSVHRSVGERLGVALDFSGPLRASTVSAVEGSARVGTYLLGALVFARVDPPGTGLHAALGAGVAVVRVGFDGQAAAPLVARSQSVVAGAGYLRADGGFEVTRWFRLGLRAVAGAATERVVATFAGNDSASWGHSFFAGFLLANLSWR